MATNVTGFNINSGAQYGPDMGGSIGNYNFGNTMNDSPSMPNANPYAHHTGGTSVSDFMPGNAPTSGAVPVGGGMLPTNTLNLTPGHGTPTVSPVPGTGSQSTDQLWNTLGLPTSGKGTQYDFGRELAATYGKGMGSAIYQYLMRGGGFNSPLTDQAIQSQEVAMNREAQSGWGNIASQLGAQGIDPNSSVNALASGQYWGDVTAKENALAAQEYYNMWSQSSSQEAQMLGSLEGGAMQHQQKKDAFWGDLISGGLGILSSAATGGFGGGIARLFGGGKGGG
jgi:hypothetical protein